MRREITICEAAARVGLHPQTLRRWEQRGWIAVPRNYYNHRIFDEKIIEKIRDRLDSIVQKDENDSRSKRKG
jgi:DNA-binding transcriptional MerR regulator